MCTSVLKECKKDLIACHEELDEAVPPKDNVTDEMLTGATAEHAPMPDCPLLGKLECWTDDIYYSCRLRRVEGLYSTNWDDFFIPDLEDAEAIESGWNTSSVDYIHAETLEPNPIPRCGWECDKWFYNFGVFHWKCYTPAMKTKLKEMTND
jgi:hypothetical protein